jgi:prepilin signal peptidase PulO-like enzyme (type II secretory pathway)
MEFSIAIPFIVGVVAWFLICTLVDTLPFTPVISPHCGNADCREPISWQDYLLFRRCPSCQKSRQSRTWIVLAVTLVSSFYIWLVPPRSIGYFGGMLVYVYLVSVAVIDLEHHWILQSLSITGIVLGVVTGFLMQGWKSMLIGGFAGFCILGLFYVFGMLFDKIRTRRLGEDSAREKALASGDVTLAIILGLILGWPLIWFSLLLGTLLAGLVSLGIIIYLLITRIYKEKAFKVFIPLGPGFILATIIVLYFPNYLASIIPK